ncbi:PP2C family protein-serine/threonine phosphatase [Streptacidiphilus rugosus]|uniref:PP2C family protein-serine/threonine phosphatase n=1 Tax=Streptacidiphilus rugosus TaxID=405783 RepID=UPI000A0145E6|nr:SpoIIE family protein phosphatase [Streptacidiphilus rugosus]
MSVVTVLMLDALPRPPHSLLASLESEGVGVVGCGLAELLSLPLAELPKVEVLMAPARVPPVSVAAVAQRLRLTGRPVPIVLVYAEDGFEALEDHVRRGHDFLVPPFLPALVRSRLQDCSERARAHAHAERMSYERELEIGREIQAGFLPEQLPTPAGWDIEVSFRPARQVAGDFYDVFELVHRRRLALVVADVCDKGVGSALFMALIRTLLRHTAEYSGLQHLVAGGQDLGALYPVGVTPMMNAVLGTNHYLTRNHLRQGYFATLFFCVLDPATGSLVYINGGHNAPRLIAQESGELSALEVTGPAVGLLPDSTFSLGYAHMEPGDTLFVYTDGVPEARCPDGRFLGEEAMLALLTEPAADGRELLDRVGRAVVEHTGGGEQHDDVTMMVVRRDAAPRAQAVAA